MDAKQVFDYYITNKVKVHGTVIKRNVKFHIKIPPVLEEETPIQVDYTSTPYDNPSEIQSVRTSNIKLTEENNELILRNLCNQIECLKLEYDKYKSLVDGLVDKYYGLKNEVEISKTFSGSSVLRSKCM